MKEAISFRNKVFSSTLVRPADTTTYTAGDVIANVTSNLCFVLGNAWAEAATAIVDDSVGRRGSETKSGSIDWLMLVSSANQTTKMEGEIWVYSAVPALVADNAALTSTDTEVETLLLGVFAFRSIDWIVSNASAGASGNAVCIIPNSSRPFSLPDVDVAGTGQLYARVVLRNAYVPVSSERITLRASITRD